jgi:hypothetical protein
MSEDTQDDITLDLSAWPAFIGAGLVGCVVVMVMVALFASHTSAQGVAADQPICKAVNVTNYPENARIAQWVGDPEKWAGYPSHFNDENPIFLYTDDTITAGYALYFDAAKQELWIFPHWSFESRGPTGGTHDLCDVVIYNLNQER